MSMLTTRRPSRLPSLWRDPFTALREEMNDLRSRLMGDEDEGWFAGAMVPALDVSETDTAIDVRMDLPGITAKDIDIQVNGNCADRQRRAQGRKGGEGKDLPSSRTSLRQLLSLGHVALQRGGKRSRGRVQGWCSDDQAAED